MRRTYNSPFIYFFIFFIHFSLSTGQSVARLVGWSSVCLACFVRPCAEVQLSSVHVLLLPPYFYLEHSKNIEFLKLVCFFAWRQRTVPRHVHVAPPNHSSRSPCRGHLVTGRRLALDDALSVTHLDAVLFNRRWCHYKSVMRPCLCASLSHCPSESI